jgi:hypothetical protein
MTPEVLAEFIEVQEVEEDKVFYGHLYHIIFGFSYTVLLGAR